jgi:hypothetical protein
MKKLISLIPVIVLGSLIASVAAGAGAVKPIVVQLGIHRFDRTSAGTIVARATPDQVGWQLPNGDVGGFGPQTFLVGRDHSIWLDDGLNNRLLVYRAGRPKTVARVVPLKFANADSEVALGPAGSLYTTRFLGSGAAHDYRLVLDRQTAAGKLLWESRLPSVGEEFCGALRVGPAGTLYCVGPHETWIPVATPAGRPTSSVDRRRRTGREPVAGGLRLVSHEFAPIGASHSVSFTLLDRRGSIVRSWRIFSRSAITEARALDSLGRDPVVVLDIQKQKSQPVPHVLWDYVVLRLGPRGAVRVALRHAVYGDNLLPDLRVGSDGALYQLSSSPSSGVEISRYSLGRP